MDQNIEQTKNNPLPILSKEIELKSYRSSTSISKIYTGIQIYTGRPILVELLDETEELNNQIELIRKEASIFSTSRFYSYH